MKVQVIDIKGNNIEEITLSDSVFKVAPNDEVLRQYVRVYRSNQRQGNSSVKTRAEVSGSGKKPWKQKGTGRARVGDKRNPLWIKGGVAHGPKPKSWSLELPKKIRHLAMRLALSTKFANDPFILDKIEFKEPKTKEMLSLLDALKVRGNVLLILDKVDENVIKSGSNIASLRITFVDNLNAYELLECKNLLITKDAAMKLEERYKE